MLQSELRIPHNKLISREHNALSISQNRNYDYLFWWKGSLSAQYRNGQIFQSKEDK